ncbi:MAG TPA: PLP-dependent aminotransferase family protein [Rhizomicrobium sp.]|nr:PLP-dependent aminotransferase family protein [Rhizomicrobium sp.]
MNPQSNIPLYEQISRAIRSAIDAGDLPPGAPLPTARELAAALGLGKNTIGAAYARLVAENYLVSNRRRGTEVSKVRFVSSIAQDKAPPQFGVSVEGANDDVAISYGAQRVLKLGRPFGTDARPFAPRCPDPSIYPRNQLGRLLLTDFCRSPGTDGNSGKFRFQSAIAAYLRHMRGVQCEPHQVIPITNLESALDLTGRVLLDPGHCVLIEEPSTFGAWEMFQASGAHVFPLPVDRAGADPDRAKSPPPRLLFVSPSVGFPFGGQMLEQRRLALLEFARRAGGIIFEADTDWELSWASKLRAIQGFDGGSRVLYFGSLHETLGPHLRVAYLVVPTHLASAFAEIANRVGYGPDGFVLSALSTFMEENEYAVHAKMVQSIYARRMGIALDACRTYVKRARPVEPTGGFHLSLLFSEDVDERAVVHMAARAGLTVTPLSLCYHQEPREKGIVLGLGLVPDRNIEASIRRLSEVIDLARTTGAVYELAS